MLHPDPHQFQQQDYIDRVNKILALSQALGTYAMSATLIFLLTPCLQKHTRNSQPESRVQQRGTKTPQLP